MRKIVALTLMLPMLAHCDVAEKSSDGEDWDNGGEVEAPPSLFGEDGDGSGSDSGSGSGDGSGSGTDGGSSSGGDGSGTDGGSGSGGDGSGTDGGSGSGGGTDGGGSDGPGTEDDADGDGVATWDDCDDTDPDSTTVATDADCDTILDTDEGESDSDGDGEPDYLDTDSDSDGIGDIFESGDGDPDTPPVDTDGDGTPDYLDADSDGDGVPDSVESGVDGTDEEPRDTDGDGRYDFADTDSDDDSLSDWDEINIHGTDPYDADSDGDGFSDGAEISVGTSPTDEESVIDGIYVEVPDRAEIEENFEFEINIQMGDVAFLLDTTGSMSGTADAMGSEFGAIVSELSPILPDAQYGFATYDDYAYSPYGSVGEDKPFILRQQITDNTTAVQAELSRIDIHFGSDLPESTMEALYQGATGGGYDQSCSGMYDGTTDVLPFLASSGDPFGGAAGESFSPASSGGGEIGGFGFRDYALPVLVYATDNELRDPDAGYGTPGGCPLDAGYSDVVYAINAIGGYTIGIMTSSSDEGEGEDEGEGGGEDEDEDEDGAVAQMEALASATGSMADTDGDGAADDLLVFTWTGSSLSFRETVTDAIEDLVNSIHFSRVALEIEGDEWGFIADIEPPYYDDIEPSAGIDVLDFTIHFEGAVAATTMDQLYSLTLNVIGDDTILLDTMDIIVVVPGSGP
jgi:hypothetical protein